MYNLQSDLVGHRTERPPELTVESMLSSGIFMTAVYGDLLPILTPRLSAVSPCCAVARIVFVTFPAWEFSRGILGWSGDTHGTGVILMMIFATEV